VFSRKIYSPSCPAIGRSTIPGIGSIRLEIFFKMYYVMEAHNQNWQFLDSILTIFAAFLLKGGKC
jgi:hypothetical protein